MRPEDIIANQGPAIFGRPLVRHLIAHERARNVIAALSVHPASPYTRQILCDILVFHAAADASSVKALPESYRRRLRTFLYFATLYQAR